MPDKSNNPFQFWEELKRRKVFRVLAMYAGAAYVAIELVNNVAEPLGLPTWTATVVILFLAIGFPIVAILSWIFDLTSTGIVKTEPIGQIVEQNLSTEPGRRRLRVGDVIIAVLFVAVVILAYPRVFKNDMFKDIRDEDGRITVAVMPFQNMTNDTIWDIWQSGIQFGLSSYLSNYPAELKIRQSNNINSVLEGEGFTNLASLTPNIARRTSQKVDANIFIDGNIMPAGPIIRINAQLNDSKTGDLIKSFEIDGPADEDLFLDLIDSLKLMVKNFLIISELTKESPLFGHTSYNVMDELPSTISPEAYRYNIQGLKAFYDTDFPAAERFFLEAVAIDSNLIQAINFLSLSYSNRGMNEQSKFWCLKAYEKKDIMTMYQKFFANWLYAVNFETFFEAVNWIKQILQYDEQQPGWYYVLGNEYSQLNQYDNAILALEKALEIYDKWEIKPLWAPNYYVLGRAYHKTGDFKKESKLYEKAERDFPDNDNIIMCQAILSLSEGDTVAGSQYTERYKTIRKNNSHPAAFITTGLAFIYSEADSLDIAEEYYRKSLTLLPEHPDMINNIAYFLIDKNRNISEGLDIINTALEFSPDNHKYLHTKGWGLYKQGNYKEALEILERSWDLRREYARYNHDAYLQLEAAKNALANQNSEQ